MIQPNVLIIDAGLGNIGSVIAALGRENCVSKRLTEPIPQEATSMFTHAILPGVGSFSAGMEAIKIGGWEKWIHDSWCVYERPLLGICLGMQLLASEGTEGAGRRDTIAGLNLIPGKVDRLEGKNNLVLPHVGWNDLRWKKPKDNIAKDLNDGDDMYFVHSYAFKAEDPKDIIAISEYGEIFTAVVGRGNCYGVQFHPEKSQKLGRRILRNFLKLPLC
jgi:glutamine amidotransferase